MLNVLIPAVLILAGALFVLFVALCLSIRREDRSPRLASRPPSAGASFARHVAGLSVRRPSGPANAQPDHRHTSSGPDSPVNCQPWQPQPTLSSWRPL
jgi:hypothetical protein